MAEKPITHIVKKGETFSDIAKRYNLPTSELQKANEIQNINILRIGMRLKIPKEINTIRTQQEIKRLKDDVVNNGKVWENKIMDNLEKGASFETSLGKFDLRKKFVPGEKINIAIIKSAFEEYLGQNGLQKKIGKDQKKMMLAYILATAKHETNNFRTLKEKTDGKKYNPPARVAKVLGNEPNDGPIYIGRGYVQITGENNYEKWSELFFGKGNKSILTKYRSVLLLNPQLSATILVKGMMEGLFTGRGLQQYMKNGGLDFVNARRTVNGTDKASLVAGYAREYLGKL